MSEHIKDGGPAFPSPSNEAGAPFQYGMSLRDWFAGQVITQSVMVKAPSNDPEESLNAAARAAYRISDAMLKAREVK